MALDASVLTAYAVNSLKRSHWKQAQVKGDSNVRPIVDHYTTHKRPKARALRAGPRKVLGGRIVPITCHDPHEICRARRLGPNDRPSKGVNDAVFVVGVQVGIHGKAQHLPGQSGRFSDRRSG